MITEENKQLLLIDLCARLPYGVICQYDCVHRCDTIVAQRINAQGKLMGIQPTFNGDIGFIIDHTKINALYDNVRPYLRPMSSMTEEEKLKLQSLQKYYFDEKYIGNNEWEVIGKVYYNTVESLDWLNENHFDYRGLIEKGLALEAPEEMYKNK